METLDYALQPIISLQTGRCLGMEALLRHFRTAECHSVSTLFDLACKNNRLPELELNLRQKAVAKFAACGFPTGMQLFLNLDPRLLTFPGFGKTETAGILRRHDLQPASVCFDLSEQHLPGASEALHVLAGCRQQGYALAIDDFGIGAAGIKLLFDLAPEYLKIDRCYISGIDTDAHKRLFVAQMVSLAHALGIQVIAEGIETKLELTVCKEVGCDMGQGYVIAPPTLRPTDLSLESLGQKILAPLRHRNARSDRRFIDDHMDVLPTLPADGDMQLLFNLFREHKQLTFCPVVDAQNRPLGILREKDLKEYTYSLYGRDLITNRAFGKRPRDFIVSCPRADINAEAESILATFSQHSFPEGILIVEDSFYRGFLSTGALLLVINEKNLAQARDQNPLTQLPGNATIQNYLVTALADRQQECVLVYFDFDNFKPFNDTYGFRQGDRAILLFGDLMRKKLAASGDFLGHVGGDDFFSGHVGLSVAEVTERVTLLCQTFAHDLESFYNPTDREKGCIEARNREGRPTCYPLLSVSAAVLQVPAGRDRPSVDDLVAYFGVLKKQAKASAGGLCSACLI